MSERLISGNEPHHVKVCNGITEQVRKCALHFQECMSSEELRYVHLEIPAKTVSG